MKISHSKKCDKVMRKQLLKWIPLLCENPETLLKKDTTMDFLWNFIEFMVEYLWLAAFAFK